MSMFYIYDRIARQVSRGLSVNLSPERVEQIIETKRGADADVISEVLEAARAYGLTVDE